MAIVLALETTEKYGSVALLDEQRLLDDVSLSHDKRSAQTLAPSIDAILRKHSVPPKNVAVVAVVVGPGSFTGLRVGVTTAKMFAYAVGAEVVGLGTDFVVAEGFLTASRNLKDLPPYLSVGIDAQRGEVCVRVFKRENIEHHLQYRAISGSNLISVVDWWKQTSQWEKLCFAGPALERYATKAPENVKLADESLWMPKASVAGFMAAKRWEHQVFTEDYFSLVPVYSRLSAAEEKRLFSEH